MIEFDNVGYINQIITTVQGEGNNVGYPVILIRFNRCNLNCPMCDSKYTWTHDDNSLSYSQIETQINNHIIKYPNIKHIMITGGEPFYQPKLLKFIINRYYKLFHIQIETNGFDIYKFDFKMLKSKNIQLNISPKLNIEAYKTDINIDKILISFQYLYEQLKKYNIDYIFKLVYCPEWRESILLFYLTMKTCDPCIDMNFWIMPLTPSYTNENFNEIYKKSCFDTIEFCKLFGYKYSPRIHVDLFKEDKWENCLRQ